MKVESNTQNACAVFTWSTPFCSWINETQTTLKFALQSASLLAHLLQCKNILQWNVSNTFLIGCQQQALNVASVWGPSRKRNVAISFFFFFIVENFDVATNCRIESINYLSMCSLQNGRFAINSIMRLIDRSEM